MKKTALYLLAIAVVAAASGGCRGGKKNAAGTADGKNTVKSGFVVSISDSLIDHRRADTINFGRVREGERIVREFKIRNSGDKAMVIMELDLSCGCVEAEYPKQPMKPGEEGVMKLTLDTRNMGGWVFKSAVMQTSLSPRPYMLFITAEIE